MTDLVALVQRRPDRGGESATRVIILAAGHARRLGPLSGLGKTHVRFRSAPALITQLVTLARAGLMDVTIVCRPEHEARVSNLVDEVATPLGLSVQFLLQGDSPGPGSAFARAVCDSAQGRPVLLLLADTIVRSIPDLRMSWIAVAPPPSERPWCLVGTNSAGRVSSLRNGTVGEEAAQPVAVGLYYFSDGVALEALCAGLQPESTTTQVELSEVLSRYLETQALWSVPADQWTDLGDLGAVSRATRSAFGTRPPSVIAVDDLGRVRKRPGHGGGAAQITFLRNMVEPVSCLFPRVWTVADDLSEITMDYVSSPTLAESYLYQSADGEVWGSLIGDLVDRIDRYLWKQLPENNPGEVIERCRLMYLDKPRRRFRRWLQKQPDSRSSRIRVNGREVLAGLEALDQLVGLLTPVCEQPVPALVHGDLNFSNILFDIESQTFRLIDPRGAFGRAGAVGDARYDAAKLRHSYAGMFDAAMHGIFTLSTLSPEEYVFRLGPDRGSAIAAIDRTLEQRGFNLWHLRLIEASLFLSMLPLHEDNPRRERILYLRGLELLDEASARRPQVNDQSLRLRERW